MSSSSSSSSAALLPTSSSSKAFSCGGKCGKAACTKSYATASGLSEHLKGDEAKKHVCTFAGCGHRFKRQRLLDDHVNAKHSNAKPYKCSDCTSAFATKYQLTLHEKTAHPPKSLPVEPVSDEDAGDKLPAPSTETSGSSPLSFASSSSSSSSSSTSSTSSSTSSSATASPASASPVRKRPSSSSMMTASSSASSSSSSPTSSSDLFASIGDRVAMLELLPRDDDFANSGVVRHRRERIVVARVPSLCQVVPHVPGTQSLVTCAYYAYASYEALASPSAASGVAEAFDALATMIESFGSVRSGRATWLELSPSAELTRALDSLRRPSRQVFAAKFTHWFTLHAAHFNELTSGRVEIDAKERDSLDVFELTTRQVADVWPDTTLLALGNERDESDDDGVRRELLDTMPNYARDAERLRSVATGATVPALVVDGGHWATIVAHRVERAGESWLMVLTTDALSKDWALGRMAAVSLDSLTCE